MPHLHVHIVPRYVTDDDPGKPPRFMMMDPPPGEQPLIPVDDYLADVAALKRLVEDYVPTPAELSEVGRVALGAAAAILDDAGRILLVRHSYGRHNWELPGGVATPGDRRTPRPPRRLAIPSGSRWPHQASQSR